LLFMAGALAGCGGSAAYRETVTISGSSSVFPVIDGLKDLYMDRNPDTNVQVEQGGSGVGIANVRDGLVDIGMSSRDLREEEKPLFETVLCLDGIAVVVNRENPVKDLTREQIAGIYKGEITNWAQVGGHDAAITLITREATSGTRGAFEEMVLDSLIIDDRLCLVQNSTGNVGIAVEYDPNAIGYMSLGVVDHFAVGRLPADALLPPFDQRQARGRGESVFGLCDQGSRSAPIHQGRQLRPETGKCRSINAAFYDRLFPVHAVMTVLLCVRTTEK